MYQEFVQDLNKIPVNNYWMLGTEEGIGLLGVPGDDEFSYDEVSGDLVEFTEDQDEAYEAYEVAYNNIMEAYKNLFESFGFKAAYG